MSNAASDDTPEDEKGTPETRSVGRPRDEALSERILAEALDQVRSVGLIAFRVNDVAAAVGCGVSTIYRRWPTRERLIADAIANRPPITFESTGDAVGDFRAAVRAIVENFGLHPAVLAAAMEIVQGDEEVGQAVRSILQPLRATIAERVGAVLGADHPSIASVVDMIPGLLLFRSVLMGESTDAGDVADEITALVLALAD